jgi:choline dehydrogenase
VVDAEMRVSGLEGVRVCDASIVPNLIGGNTNAPAIMFGEKLASLLSNSEVPTAPAVGGREATLLRKEAP